jgi:hypothetical protein
MEPTAAFSEREHSDASAVPVPLSVCPVCGGYLLEVRAKLQCTRCHTTCETCCDGGAN